MRKFEIVTTFAQKNPVLPKRQTENSAGYDLSSLCDITIEPGKITLIPTGIKVMMEHDEVLMIYPRSSLAIKRGLMMSNSVGVIDADYYGNPDNEGHIMIPLYNTTLEPVTIKAYERVAQGIFTKYLKTVDDEVQSKKRSGGFGSSGQ